MEIDEKLEENLEKIPGALKATIPKEEYKKLEKKHQEELEETKIKLGKAYENINQILKTYCDLKEDYYSIVSLWIIGTYIHDEFSSFPYLFINAMRGSGKSRLLKLISALSHNGKVIADLREAVLFRTAKGSTICIDEFENVEGKEKSTLRELLNAAYKKGTKVERMKKISGKDGERHEVETFDLYTSIAMANIWGMDEVLEDRCITLILERSNDPIKTRLIEDFEDNELILATKELLNSILVSLCRVVLLKNITKGWNAYLLYNDTTTHTTITTHNNNTTPLQEIFKKIDKSGIDGRNIELLYPLFIISQALGWNLFEDVLKIGKEMVDQKKGDQFIESRDISLFDFISRMSPSVEYRPILEITRGFKEFVGEIEDDDRWVNSKWMGKALKRLNLIISKKRVAKGREVILDIGKAAEKIKMFRVVEKNE